VETASEVLKRDPNNEKALWRRAKVVINSMGNNIVECMWILQARIGTWDLDLVSLNAWSRLHMVTPICSKRISFPL